MADQNPISIRVDQEDLDAIDEAADGNRSKFMLRCAVKQARRIIKGKAPRYLDPGSISEPVENPTTISVVPHNGQLEEIEPARSMLNHKISTFILWSSLVEINRKFRKGGRRCGGWKRLGHRWAGSHPRYR